MNEPAKRIVQDGPDLKNNRAYQFALKSWLIPWTPLCLTLWWTPGYITPFLSIPIAQKILIAIAMWQALCCIAMSRTENNTVRYSLIVLSAPQVFFFALLGPATVAILRALPFQ